MRIDGPRALLHLAAFAAVLAFGTTAAAYDGFIAPLDEIPLTSSSLVGARAMGMGGVAFAVADDASAISTNPAALARLRRVEISGGLSRTSDEMTGEAFGEEFDSTLSRTRFSSFRFAYPFPTFRGSLVVGLATDLAYDFDDDFLAFYEDDFTGSGGQAIPQAESFIAEGSIQAWRLGAAIEASEKVSLGATVSYFSGDYEQNFVWDVRVDDGDLPVGYDAFTQYQFRTSSDVRDAWRASLGGLFYAADNLAVALVLDSPVTLTFDGVISEAARLPGEDLESAEPLLFTDKITLPFGFGGGLAFNPTDHIMIGADVYYTDWSEIRYETPDDIIDPVTRRLPYEATTEYRVGVEVTLPAWPIRLRGGYASRPVPYQVLNVEEDRSYFTFGAGLLIDTVFTVDAAVVLGGYERAGDGYDYTETVDDTRFLLEATYRF